MVVNISRNVKFRVIFSTETSSSMLGWDMQCLCVCVSADWYEEFDKENNTQNCNHQHVVCLYFFYTCFVRSSWLKKIGCEYSYMAVNTEFPVHCLSYNELCFESS